MPWILLIFKIIGHKNGYHDNWFKIQGQFASGGTTFSEYPHGGNTLLELAWREHWTQLAILNQYPRGGSTQNKKISQPLNENQNSTNSIWIQRGGITQSEFNLAGPLSQNSSYKRNYLDLCRHMIKRIHGAGSLNQNSTWRDHSVRIQPIKGTT